MNVIGAIQSKSEKSGKTNGREWTRTTITINGDTYSTLRPIIQTPGAYVEVEYEDSKYGHNILSLNAANPAQAPQTFFTPPAGEKTGEIKQATYAAFSSATSEILNRIYNIEDYLAQFDKKYLELFQGVAERLAQEHATIQTIAGTTTKLSSDVHDFMLEQAEKEAKV